jgi:hypothetical protein
MNPTSAYYSSGGTDPLGNFKQGEILGLASAEGGLMLRVIDKVSHFPSFSNSRWCRPGEIVARPWQADAVLVEGAPDLSPAV